MYKRQDADLDRARELRSLLRDALARTGLDDTLPHRADAALRAFPVRMRLSATGHVELAPEDDGVPGALATLLTVAVRRGADGSWDRMRACAAPDCRWVFYDDSRNGAGRWCSMSSCGNRAKTTRYRARKAREVRIPE